MPHYLKCFSQKHEAKPKSKNLNIQNTSLSCTAKEQPNVTTHMGKCFKRSYKCSFICCIVYKTVILLFYNKINPKSQSTISELQPVFY